MRDKRNVVASNECGGFGRGSTKGRGGKERPPIFDRSRFTASAAAHDLLVFQTRQILRPGFDDLHECANLGVGSRRIDQRESGGHVRVGTRGGVVGACVGVWVELTPAILNDSFEIGGVQDDMGAAIGSVRATGVAAEGAEANVGRTFA